MLTNLYFWNDYGISNGLARIFCQWGGALRALLSMGGGGGGTSFPLSISFQIEHDFFFFGGGGHMGTLRIYAGVGKARVPRPPQLRPCAYR